MTYFLVCSTFFTISKFQDSQMFKTISPHSDHNVYLSRPVCQKMVKIWFFTFKYHRKEILSCTIVHIRKRNIWKASCYWGPIKNFPKVQKMAANPSDQVLWVIFSTLLAFSTRLHRLLLCRFYVVFHTINPKLTHITFLMVAFHPLILPHGK